MREIETVSPENWFYCQEDNRVVFASCKRGCVTFKGARFIHQILQLLLELYIVHFPIVLALCRGTIFHNVNDSMLWFRPETTQNAQVSGGRGGNKSGLRQQQRNPRKTGREFLNGARRHHKISMQHTNYVRAD